MITAGMRKAAGVVCLWYIGVQTFQWWVFSHAPAPGGVSEFLFAGEPESLLRSWLMLLSMFGLFYLFFVLCFLDPRQSQGWSILAFSGFSLFFLLEITLRSVELFYTQIQLPRAYLAATAEQQASILAFVSQFQGIQTALYFPLGLGWASGSVLLGIVFPGTPRRNYLVKGALYFNGARLLLRMVTVYLGVTLFPSSLYGLLYLPMVYLTFVPIAWWLLAPSELPIDVAVPLE
jgi:hypothetical protein